MKLLELIKKLDKTLLLLVALLLVAFTVALLMGGSQLASDGIRQAVQLLDMVWIRLLLGFTLGGLIRVLISGPLIAKWLGHSSGFKGILIGSYIGIIIPGGPWVFLPIIASIYGAGAGVGPVIALMTGRALLAINNLVVWQIPFLGTEIPLSRYIPSLLLPPLLGLAGIVVFRMISRLSGPAKLDTGETGLPGHGDDDAEPLAS